MTMHHRPTTTAGLARDVHAGRPVAPEYRERGERLMREWAREDVFGKYGEETVR